MTGLFSKNFIRYSAFVLIDKLLSAGFFFILLDSFSVEIYNSLEYVFAIGAGLYVVFEFGFSTYLFRLYQTTDAKRLSREEKEIDDSLKKIIILISVASIISISFGFKLITLALLRVALLVILKYKTSLYRLKDKPSLIFIYSIPFNSLLCLILFFLNPNSLIEILILFHITFLLIVCKPWRFKTLSINHKIINDNILFTWPIILNVLLVSTLSNSMVGIIYQNRNIYILTMQ